MDFIDNEDDQAQKYFEKRMSLKNERKINQISTPRDSVNIGLEENPSDNEEEKNSSPDSDKDSDSVDISDEEDV